MCVCVCVCVCVCKLLQQEVWAGPHVLCMSVCVYECRCEEFTHGRSYFYSNSTSSSSSNTCAGHEPRDIHRAPFSLQDLRPMWLQLSHEQESAFLACLRAHTSLAGDTFWRRTSWVFFFFFLLLFPCYLSLTEPVGRCGDVTCNNVQGITWFYSER